MILNKFFASVSKLKKGSNNSVKFFINSSSDKLVKPPTDEIGSEFNFAEKRFSDQTRLTVWAGDGGSGGLSFYQDRKVRKGAPDGGNGGRGGHIYLKAVASLNDYRVFRAKMQIRGNNGESGQHRGKDGKNGGDLYVNVPLGSVVYEITGEEKDPTAKRKFKKQIIKDLNEEGETVMVAKGGAGGIGNYTKRELKHKQLGSKGQQKELFLELKLLADIGLVGFPNVGKSTLLASISRAIPKIANYPFTTLKPTVGKVKFIDQIDFTVADIPGIIEDAHANKGLGLEFLRHIDRTKAFVYVLDISISEENKLLNQFQVLKKELDCYKANFSDRPSIIVVNKADAHSDAFRLFNEFNKNLPFPAFLTSIKHGIGLSEVVMAMRKLVESEKKLEKEEMKKKAKHYEDLISEF